MFSKTLPFTEFRWTAQIITALQQNQVPKFESRWGVPQPLEELILLCLQPDPLKRPRFEEIVDRLLVIAEDIPSLHQVVLAKWKEHGHNKADSDTATHSLLLDQNLERLAQQEGETLAQIEQLQLSLIRIQQQIEEAKKTKEQLARDLSCTPGSRHSTNDG